MIGIPMGTNCAPPLANLYLYRYESSFIDSLRTLKGPKEAHEFHMSFRLIDDVLSLDNPNFKKALCRSAEEVDEDGVPGMYPAALILNETSIYPLEVNFL
jgi:hypothetical protein